MLTTISILAVVSVGAVLVTGARVVGLRKIVQHATKVDVAFTAGTAFLMAGTLTGIAAAILGGLIMALVLSALRVFFRAVDGFSATIAAVKEPASAAWEYNCAPYLREGELSHGR